MPTLQVQRDNHYEGVLTKNAFERQLNQSGFPASETRHLEAKRPSANYGHWLYMNHPEEFNKLWMEACAIHSNSKSLVFMNRITKSGVGSRA